MIWAERNCLPAVRDGDFKRFLRFPPHRPLSGAVAETANWARTWYATHGQPWCCAIAVPELFAVPGDSEEPLAHPLHDQPDAVLVAASAGPEAEAEARRRWLEAEPDRYYFLECYAAAVVDALVSDAARRLVAAGRISVSARFRHCPGYRGWPVSDNAVLVRRLQRLPLPGPMAALESGMLSPKASQVACFGLASVRVPPQVAMAT